MRIGKFISDVLGKVVSNILVLGLTALVFILGIKYLLGIDILGFFF